MPALLVCPRRFVRWAELLERSREIFRGWGTQPSRVCMYPIDAKMDRNARWRDETRSRCRTTSMPSGVSAAAQDGTADRSVLPSFLGDRIAHTRVMCARFPVVVLAAAGGAVAAVAAVASAVRVKSETGE